RRAIRDAILVEGRLHHRSLRGAGAADDDALVPLRSAHGIFPRRHSSQAAAGLDRRAERHQPRSAGTHPGRLTRRDALRHVARISLAWCGVRRVMTNLPWRANGRRRVREEPVAKERRAETGADRRQFERVLVDLEVDYSCEDTFLFAYITDISA